MNDSFIIDFKRDSNLPALGTHTFKISEYKPNVGPQGPYWGYRCTITDNSPDRGKTIFLTISLSEAAAWKRNEFLDAIGAPKGGRGDGSKFLGKYFRGTVAHDKERNAAVISNMMPHDGTTLHVEVETPTQTPLEIPEDDIPF
ncbi:MAG TPA: hypothetical protein VFF49_10810 [Thermodesulfobacteriota bacterium]|nr:hypothetical protein [Thermodesulfobacteriota bacterium]